MRKETIPQHIAQPAYVPKKIIFRPWGSMVVHIARPSFWIKTLSLRSGGKTSVQLHHGRGELWVCIRGEVIGWAGEKQVTMRPFQTLHVPRHMIHRLGSKTGGSVLEFAYGEPREDDIVRLADDYGRI